MRRFLLAYLVAATNLAGCTTHTPPLDSEAPIETGVVRDPETGQASFLRPTAQVGRWWSVHVATDFGFGFLQDIDGKLVVSHVDDAGFTVGSDVEDVGVFDSYFDSFYVGTFDADFNPRIGDNRVELYHWPLAANQSWTTPWTPQGFEGLQGTTHAATLTVTAFEDDASTWAPRLRIQGNTTNGQALDYDYSAQTGWMTYFRLVNATTGQVLVSVDFREAGIDYVGDVHHVTRTPLHQRVAVVPPCDEDGNCDPTWGPLPPTDVVQVPDGYAWVEAIRFLFTFTIGGAGGGLVACTLTRPDGTLEPRAFVGEPGVDFDAELHRAQWRSGATGAWTVTWTVAATGGGFVGLFGFHDATVTLEQAST